MTGLPPIGRPVHLVLPGETQCVDAQVIGHCYDESDELVDCVHLRRMDNRGQLPHVQHEPNTHTRPPGPSWHRPVEHL